MEPFAAIADPVRRRILEKLASGERTAGELGEGFGISQPAVSKHLRILREAGLVAATAQSQRRVYRLTPAPLDRVDVWLAECRNMWQQRLVALAATVKPPDGLNPVPVASRYPGRLASYATCGHLLRAIRAA